MGLKKKKKDKNLIEQYPMDYCKMLELCYGKGMMSEGGGEAIDFLFKGEDLSGKKILEIGYGLGGLAQYLDQNFSNINYQGVEINPEMQVFATEKYGKENIVFKTLESSEVLPFENESFDFVFSKGVLVHLEDKKALFSEVFRILKNKGKFLINDWLSPDGEGFGAGIDYMCEAEGLLLYPVSPDSYQKCLEASGFSFVSREDETKQYAQYNLDVLEKLKTKKIESKFIELFSQPDYEEALKSYALIAESFSSREALVKKISVRKK